MSEIADMLPRADTGELRQPVLVVRQKTPEQLKLEEEMAELKKTVAELKKENTPFWKWECKTENLPANLTVLCIVIVMVCLIANAFIPDFPATVGKFCTTCKLSINPIISSATDFWMFSYNKHLECAVHTFNQTTFTQNMAQKWKSLPNVYFEDCKRGHIDKDGTFKALAHHWSGGYVTTGTIPHGEDAYACESPVSTASIQAFTKTIAAAIEEASIEAFTKTIDCVFYVWLWFVAMVLAVLLTLYLAFLVIKYCIVKWHVKVEVKKD